MYAIGTALKTRIDIPDVFKTIHLDKNEAVFGSSNSVLAIMWKDNKDVVVLSFYHTDLAFEETRNRKRKRGLVEEVRKPKFITDYNNGMFGVDRMDQRLACFPIMRRSVKAYKKICFYLLDLAIYNSFALCNKVRPPKPKEKRNYKDLRINLAEQLLLSSQLQNRTSQRANAGQQYPMRLQARNWAHYPLKI